MGLVQWVDKLRDSFSYDDELLENDYSYDDYDEIDINENYSDNDNYSVENEDDHDNIKLLNDVEDHDLISSNLYQSVENEMNNIDNKQVYSVHEKDNNSIDDFDDYEEFDTDDISPFSGSHYINIKAGLNQENKDFAVEDNKVGDNEKSFYNKIKDFGGRIKINESKINDYKNKMMLEEVEEMSYDEQKPQMVYDLNRNIQIETNSLAVLEVNLSTFDDVKEICAAIKSGNGVICYMTNVEAQIANQYICYLNGFCSALNAQMNKIADATFFLTPKQVRYIKVEERERYNRSNLNNMRRSAM